MNMPNETSLQMVTLRLTRAEAKTLKYLIITEERKLESGLHNSSRDYGESEPVPLEASVEIVELSLLHQKIHDQI